MSAWKNIFYLGLRPRFAMFLVDNFFVQRRVSFFIIEFDDVVFIVVVDED